MFGDPLVAGTTSEAFRRGGAPWRRRRSIASSRGSAGWTPSRSGRRRPSRPSSEDSGRRGVRSSPGLLTRSATTTSLRHPLHPALTDIPAGAWLTGVVADYVAISSDSFPRSAGTIALAVGLVVALGAAITGYTDFHETMGLARRTAIAHGLWMTGVFSIEAISLVFRLTGVSGLYPVAVVLATIGLLLATVGMYVGGHVVYGFGTMVNRGAFTDRFRNTIVVGRPQDFAEGQMRKVEANGMTVLVTRQRSALYACYARIYS